MGTGDTMKLFVTFLVPIDNVDEFEIVDTDMKASYIPDVIEAYIQESMGKGEDSTPPNILSTYQITIDIDLLDDTITVTSNCGNKCLTLGILVHIMGRLHEGTSLA